MNSRDFWTDDQPDSATAQANPGGSLGPESEGRALTPVDRIAVRKLGGFNFLTPEQWIAMPSDSRKKAIQQQTVVFMADGETLPLRDALLYLKWLADQMVADRLGAPEERPVSPTQRLVPKGPAYPPPSPGPGRQPPMPPLPNT